MAVFRPNPTFAREQIREFETRAYMERFGRKLAGDISRASAMAPEWGAQEVVEMTDDGVTVGTDWPFGHFDEWGSPNWPGTQPIRRTASRYGLKIRGDG